MSTAAVPTPSVVASAQYAEASRPSIIRTAQDVSRIVNVGAAKGSNARIVIAIARGGVFLDAY